MKLDGLTRPSKIQIGILLLLGTLVGSSVDDYGGIKNQEFTLGAGNNGALQLIVQAYVDSILRDLQNDGGTFNQAPMTLDGPIVEVIRDKIKKLPQHLRNHPALAEKRLWIGPNQPDFDPFPLKQIKAATYSADRTSSPSLEKSTQKKNSQKTSNPVQDIHGKQAKRTGLNINLYPAEEICGTDRQWELINRTTDFYAHEVEIVHTEEFQQYIFVYRCVAQRGPCLGISPLYNSECEMRYGWVNMYHRRLDIRDSTSQWGFVAVPHHCACKITPKFIGRD